MCLFFKGFFGVKVTMKIVDESLGKYQMIFQDNPLVEKGYELKIIDIYLEELLCGIIEGASDLINIKTKCIPLLLERDLKQGVITIEMLVLSNEIAKAFDPY